MTDVRQHRLPLRVRRRRQTNKQTGSQTGGQHRCVKQLQDTFGCMVQGSFLTHMYSVGRHSRRSSSSRNRTGKPYAAHLARLDYSLIYLPTQVQLTLTKIIKIVAT